MTMTAKREGETLIVTRHSPAAARTWAVARIALGWVFLWAFLDKTFALGFNTGRTTLDGGGETVSYFGKSAWLFGFGDGSPTFGFLKFGTKGWFAGFFQSFAGTAWADWLFMLGLLTVGIALIFGIGMRLGTISGVALLSLMWLAAPPMAVPAGHNPFMDDHIIYAIVMIGLLLVGAGDVWGFGRRWKETDLVKRFPILK